MNRFRRKSEASRRAGKAKEAALDASASASASQAGAKGKAPVRPRRPSSPPLPPQLRSPLLPVADDFRTSLILVRRQKARATPIWLTPRSHWQPHLTARFALLRSDDGRLVSLETMQANLECVLERGERVWRTELTDW